MADLGPLCAPLGQIGDQKGQIQYEAEISLRNLIFSGKLDDDNHFFQFLKINLIWGILWVI